ncbi:MAG TPA: ferric reductase-like transmembrane domain-containing protein [Ktedonobacteraceae bacterium]|jgi:hypothetical protein|nr:ferric reductase-like transmembrane domain-containing protein [Ktedonobacteraceae bacterium]
MALASKSTTRPVRRIWKTPGSKLNWFFLALSLVILVWVYLLYRSAIATQQYPGPFTDPLRDFGIVSFVLVLLTAAYTLRRRFMRGLPGRVQDWLWLHIWFGITSILIACMHDNFQSVTHDFSFMLYRFTEAAGGTSALYALFALVLTGIIGRLLDVWQARIIAREADTNGVGISRSVEDRLFELSLAVERLSAGKSPPFKDYCQQALHAAGSLPSALPMLPPNEVSDFQHAYETLGERMRLAASLQRQKRAQFVIRAWRYIHIPLAIAAIAVISLHSSIELYKMLILHS